MKPNEIFGMIMLASVLVPAAVVLWCTAALMLRDLFGKKR